MDVFGAKLLGRALQPGIETINAGSCLQVCCERGFLCRAKEHSLPEGHGKNWRNQKWDGEKGLWKRSAFSQRKVRNQEAKMSWRLRGTTKVCGFSGVFSE